MGRPPILDYEAKLTEKQHDLVFGTLVTDAWVELQRGALHARYGIQLTAKNMDFVDQVQNELGSFIVKPPQDVYKTPPRSNERFLQKLIRTPAHPEFTLYRQAFYPKGKKIVPAVSYLLLFVSFNSLAYMLSCDGSIKSEQNKSMEIHVQCFSEQSVGRLCIALYEKLGILCKPSRERKRYGEGYQWVLYICGESHDILYEKVRPLMVKSMQYKVPSPRLREYRMSKNVCKDWYLANNDLKYREDISLELT